jgi:hypothetical protein
MTAQWKSVVADLRAALQEIEEQRGPHDIPDELMTKVVDANRAMMSFPVTSIAMLAEKMDLLVEQFGVDDLGNGDEGSHIYADILRLAGRSEHLGNDDDAEIVSAWSRFRTARAEIDAMPAEQCGKLFDSPAEKRLWGEVDGAEITIHAQPARTLRGLKIKLLSSLCHVIEEADGEQAARAATTADLIAMDEDLEWKARLVLSAITSIEAMEACNG